jgi:hypothetical protein
MDEAAANRVDLMADMNALVESRATGQAALAPGTLLPAQPIMPSPHSEGSPFSTVCDRRKCGPRGVLNRSALRF